MEVSLHTEERVWLDFLRSRVLSDAYEEFKAEDAKFDAGTFSEEQIRIIRNMFSARRKTKTFDEVVKLIHDSLPQLRAMGLPPIRGMLGRGGSGLVLDMDPLVAKVMLPDWVQRDDFGNFDVTPYDEMLITSYIHNMFYDRLATKSEEEKAAVVLVVPKLLKYVVSSNPRQRSGPVAFAALISERMPGLTMLRMIQQETLTEDNMRLVGKALFDFHAYAKCAHGDLHPGNILIDLERKRVAFIDTARSVPINDSRFIPNDRYNMPDPTCLYGLGMAITKWARRRHFDELFYLRGSLGRVAHRFGFSAAQLNHLFKLYVAFLAEYTKHMDRHVDDIITRFGLTLPKGEYNRHYQQIKTAGDITQGEDLKLWVEWVKHSFLPGLGMRYMLKKIRNRHAFELEEEEIQAARDGQGRRRSVAVSARK